jgi:hypothetical protein
MKHLEDLLKIHENCKESILNLTKDNERASSILSEIHSETDSPEIKDSINEIKAKTEAMLLFAKDGNINDFMNLKNEMTKKYGRSN